MRKLSKNEGSKFFKGRNVLTPCIEAYYKGKGQQVVELSKSLDARLFGVTFYLPYTGRNACFTDRIEALTYIEKILKEG